MRIVYMGTPEFAVEPLRRLVEGGYNVVGVITMPDKPAGRGYNLQPSAVKVYAEEAGLNILQPVNLKDEEFLAELSKTDGYPGEIDTEEDGDYAFGNYYKVDVDESGYGVYAYLCSYSEIQEAIRYDTELGELAYKIANDAEGITPDDVKKLQHQVTLNLSAQKDDDTVVAVSTVSGLQEAIATGVGSVIQLNGDITVGAESTILIPENTRIMLDLNGNTLTNQAGTAITAQPGSSLTLTGGTLIQYVEDGETKPSNTYGVRSVGAEVVMNQMTVQDFQYGVYVGDNAKDNELDSRVYIKNCTVAGEPCAAFISGNGLLTEQ